MIVVVVVVSIVLANIVAVVVVAVIIIIIIIVVVVVVVPHGSKKLLFNITLITSNKRVRLPNIIIILTLGRLEGLLFLAYRALYPYQILTQGEAFRWG